MIDHVCFITFNSNQFNLRHQSPVQNRYSPQDNCPYRRLWKIVIVIFFLLFFINKHIVFSSLGESTTGKALSSSCVNRQKEQHCSILVLCESTRQKIVSFLFDVNRQTLSHPCIDKWQNIVSMPSLQRKNIVSFVNDIKKLLNQKCWAQNVLLQMN